MICILLQFLVCFLMQVAVQTVQLAESEVEKRLESVQSAERSVLT